MVRAYSSVVEHYVDIVGVASSILATPTIREKAPVSRGLFHMDYLPCQLGLRFSAKASEPSRASALMNTGAM